MAEMTIRLQCDPQTGKKDIKDAKGKNACADGDFAYVYADHNVLHLCDSFYASFISTDPTSAAYNTIVHEFSHLDAVLSTNADIDEEYNPDRIKKLSDIDLVKNAETYSLIFAGGKGVQRRVLKK